MAPRCSWEEAHLADLLSSVPQPSADLPGGRGKGNRALLHGLLGEALDGLFPSSRHCYRQPHLLGTASPTRCSDPAGNMDDAKILRDLFDGTGVMSALDHSKIEGANNPEALNIDAQAARIARKAAEALKRSRQVCQVR